MAEIDIGDEPILIPVSGVSNPQSLVKTATNFKNAHRPYRPVINWYLLTVFVEESQNYWDW